MSAAYKILPRADWEAAAAQGRYDGSPVDVQDGFIHLSAASQAAETARKYFAGQSGLVMVRFETDDLGPALRWEPSRGGALFPHLYASLPTALALEARDLPLGPDGIPQLGELIG